MLTLYGRTNSVNVQKALFALAEAGAAYERVDAGLAFGVVDTAEYRAMNPNGLVPTLKDGDLVVWESNAIVRYVAARFAAGTLWPADPAERARADMWMDWQQTRLQPAVGPAFTQLVRTPPERRDASVVEAGRQASEGVAGLLDTVLAASEFLGGDRFGMAEIAVAPVIHRWLHLPLQRTPRPHLERWYAAVAARPAAGVFTALPLT
jgi:glutathione S-transferase